MRTRSIGRRQPDPLPLTWEVPAGFALTWLCLAGAGLLAGQATAGLLSGRGWRWPDSPHLLPAVGGLLTGHVGVGVPGTPPAAWLVYLLIGVCQLLLLAVSVWATVRFWASVGPGRRYGMATRVEAETVLGVGRLRRVRKIIRPRPVRARRTPGQCLGGGQRPADLPEHTGRRRRGERRRHGELGGRRAGRRHHDRRAGPGHRSWWPDPVYSRDGGLADRSRAAARCGDLWVPYDRTAGVYGPQGSGKTLDLLTPALLSAPGAALVTLTKADDLLLTVDARSSAADGKPGGRPVAVLDPFGLAPGLRSWCGTRSTGVWTRWSPNGGRRRSPPAPSKALSRKARGTQRPGSTPPKGRRCCRRSSTPPR